jgi:hypothetical protein
MSRYTEATLGIGMAIQIYMSIRLFDKVVIENYKDLKENNGVYALAVIQLVGTMVFYVCLMMWLSVGKVKEYCSEQAGITPGAGAPGGMFITPAGVIPFPNFQNTLQQASFPGMKGKTKAILYSTFVLSYLAAVIPGIILLATKTEDLYWQAGWLVAGAIIITFCMMIMIKKRF